MSGKRVCEGGGGGSARRRLSEEERATIAAARAHCNAVSLSLIITKVDYPRLLLFSHFTAAHVHV